MNHTTSAMSTAVDVGEHVSTAVTSSALLRSTFSPTSYTFHSNSKHQTWLDHTPSTHHLQWWVEGGLNGWVGGKIDEWVSGWVDRWVGGYNYGWMDWRVDGFMDRKMVG
ncbi:unnamed protein product [Arctogadus glacialis]